MNCLSHSSTPAVAVCKTCGAAVCSACAQKSGQSITCSDSCTTEAVLQQEIIERSKMIYGLGPYNSKSKLSASSLFLVLMGMLFLIFGIYDYFYSDSYLSFIFFPFGVVFLISYAIEYYRRSKLGLRI